MKHGIHNSSKWLIAATAAVAVIAGGLALGSNMGFKFNAQIVAPGGALPKGDNWLSIPDNSPYNKANLLCQHLSLVSTGANATRGIVARLNAVSGSPQTYICGTLTTLTTTNFSPNAGDGVRIRNSTTVPTANGIIVGSDNPNLPISIAAAALPLPKGDNWVSVPYHTTAIKAADLCTDIGLTSTGANATRGIVARLNAATGSPQTYICGTLTTLTTTNFTMNTGDAARIRNPVAKPWMPSHF